MTCFLRRFLINMALLAFVAAGVVVAAYGLLWLTVSHPLIGLTIIAVSVLGLIAWVKTKAEFEIYKRKNDK